MNAYLHYVDRRRTAYIMYKDFCVGELIEEFCDLTGDSTWSIKPYYDNIEACKAKYGHCQTPAGIDIDLHKDIYIRNYVPCFVEQRVIPDGRPDLPARLKAIKMTYNDLFEVLCRTHGICGNDDLYVSRRPDMFIDIKDINTPYDIPEDPDAFNDEGWLNPPEKGGLKPGEFAEIMPWA